MNDLLDNFDHFGLRSRQIPKSSKSQHYFRSPHKGNPPTEPPNKGWASFLFPTSRKESSFGSESEKQPMDTTHVHCESMIKTEPEDFDSNCNLIGQRLDADDATFSFFGLKDNVFAQTGSKKITGGQRLNPMFEMSHYSTEKSQSWWTKRNQRSYSKASDGSNCIIAPARSVCFHSLFFIDLFLS